MPTTQVTIPKVAEDNILLMLRDRVNHFPRDQVLRRLRKFDRAYHMESENTKGEDFESRYKDTDVAIVNPNATADHTFYSDTFLSSHPVFSAVSSADKMDAAKALDAKMEKDQREFAWVANLSRALQDVAKHNRGFVEVTWAQEKVTQVATDLNEENSAATQDVVIAGNKFTHIDLYNCIWDTSVPISHLSKRGEFFAYTDLITQIELYRELQQLGEGGEFLKVPADMWKSVTQNQDVMFQYEIPEISNDPDNNQVKKGETDWYAHLGISKQEGKYANNKRYYQRTVKYVRIIPAALGFTNAEIPSANKPHVMKFIIINNQFVIYAERQTDLHAYLPVVGATAIEDSTNWLTKSPAQLTLNHQKTAKMMQDRMFAMLDRLIGDRGLYDSQRVAPESISSKVPDAKIPARPSALNGLTGIYQQIPFNPGNFGYMTDMINQVKVGADDTAGLNKAQQGQFTRGNKTLGEWNDVMGNADGKQYARAMYLESTFFSTIKYLIKSNYFQYQTTESVYSSSERDMKTVNPAELRKSIQDIRLTDGLKSAEKLLNSGGLEMMLEIILRNPQFQMEYSVPKVFAHLLMQGKGIDLRDYALTPEEKQQQQQMMLAQQNQQQPQ